MQSNTNYQSLISQLPQLTDEQFKRDYLNHLEWTESIGAILPLIDDDEALRVVKLALDIDLILGAFLAGKVKSELQSETVGWIYELEISDELKLKLLTKTKSKVAVYFLEDFIKNIYNEPPHLSYLYENLISRAIKELEIVDTELYTRILVNLLEDERQWVRRMGIAIFGGHIDNSEISILIRLLKDENKHIRCKAISALGEITDDSLLEVIIEALNDEDRSVRGITVKALGRIGGELAEELIIHAFLDKNDFVSKKVFETLLKIDKNKAIELIFLASQCDDAEVRRKAALFLGKIVNKSDRVSDLPLLIKLLNDENPKVRKTADEELRIVKTGIESPEFKALRKEYQELYWEAKIDIEEIINESDLTTLLLKSEGSEYYPRKAASKAIDIKIAKAENIEDTKEDLIAALQHENPEIRCGAANYIGKIGDKSVIPNLLKALQDEESKVRSRAIISLKSIADESIIIPALLQTLKDESYTVRVLAADLLGEITDNSTTIPPASLVNALIEALEDKNIGVKRTAICTLSKIDSEQAAEFISASLPYKDNFIDNIAASILSKNGKLEYIPHLWKALVKAKYINQAREINFNSATNNLYSAIEKIQQQHQLYNPEFC